MLGSNAQRILGVAPQAKWIGCRNMVNYGVKILITNRMMEMEDHILILRFVSHVNINS